MFAKTIVLSDDFLDMPLGARALYMTMGMLADDDGFVNNAKSIIRITGATNDDLKVLIAKRFVIPFEDGVMVIKHWRINNYLRSDRRQETKYIKNLMMLEVDKNGAYTEKNLGIPSNGIPSMGIPRLVKESKGELSKGKDNIKTYAPTYNESEPALYDLPTNKNDTFFPVTQKDIEEWSNLYPAVDIDQQLRNMLGWLKSNPTKRKTMKGMPRFINSWLSREQDAYHPTAPGKKKGHDLEDTYSAIRDWAASKEDT